MKIEAENSVDPIAAIVAKVEAGESVRSCCDKPGAPTRNEFRRVVRADPVLRARYDAAIAKWSAPHARSRHHFDAIVERIKAGDILADIFQTEGPSFPDTCSFRKFLKSSPEHAERYRAAFRHREASPNARGSAPKYTDAELRQAAARLAATQTRYVSVTRVAPNAPHARTLMKARARSTDLCAVIEGAMTNRITRLKIKDGPMFKPLTPGLVLPARRTARRVYARHTLKRALSQNEIYAAVDAAVPKYFAPYDRDDIIAQTVLEVIEDCLDLETVASVAHEIISEHFDQKRVDTKTKSLDAPLLSDSNMTFGDTISNGW